MQGTGGDKKTNGSAGLRAAAISDRLLEMLSQLNQTYKKVLPKEVLAERLGVNERTIRRDIRRYQELLEERIPCLPLTLPQLSIELRDGVSYVVLDKRQKVSLADAFRYAAFHLATRPLTVVESKVLGASALEVLNALEAASDPEIVERAQRSFHYHPANPARFSDRNLDILEDLVFGLWHQRTCAIRYHDPHCEETALSFDPFTLVLHLDTFHVIGRTLRHAGADFGELAGNDHGEGDEHSIVTLPLHHILAIEVLKEESFEIPPAYSPEGYLDSTFGLQPQKMAIERLVLAFSAKGARRARRQIWPGETRWFVTGDGREALEVHTQPTVALRRWFLTWHTDLEVLSPAPIREWVVNALLEGLSVYR